MSWREFGTFLLGALGILLDPIDKRINPLRRRRKHGD